MGVHGLMHIKLGVLEIISFQMGSTGSSVSNGVHRLLGVLDIDFFRHVLYTVGLHHPNVREVHISPSGYGLDSSKPINFFASFYYF